MVYHLIRSIAVLGPKECRNISQVIKNSPELVSRFTANILCRFDIPPFWFLKNNAFI